VPEIQRFAVLNPAKAVVRPPIAERAEWDDPSDQNTRSKTSRQVLGFRRCDPLITLNKRSPKEITEHHLTAVERFRDDHEIAQGATGGGDITGVRGFALSSGPSERQLIAMDAYRGALDGVGRRLGQILVSVALNGCDLKTYAERTAQSEHVVKGYLIAALDRLVDVYESPQKLMFR
jgi:hypothetical protein